MFLGLSEVKIKCIGGNCKPVSNIFKIPLEYAENESKRHRETQRESHLTVKVSFTYFHGWSPEEHVSVTRFGPSVWRSLALGRAEEH